MDAGVGQAQAELLGVLADLLAPEEWEGCAWLGPEAWLASPFEVAGGLWIAPEQEDVAEELGPMVAHELEDRFDDRLVGNVVAARQVLPGEGTILVWYRRLN